MPNLDFGTRDTSLGAYLTSSGEVYSDVVDIPNGREAANGSRPVKVYEIAAWVGAYSGTISCRFELAGASTSAFSLGTQSGGADASGYKSISKYYSGANANERFTIIGSGGFYFDRGGSGTAVASTGFVYDGAIAGRLNYGQVPSAPGWGSTPARPGGSGEIIIDWVAPSDDGDLALTGYTIQYSKSSTFASGVTTLEVTGGSRTISGLDIATKYYFRVAARNSVADHYNTSGPYSSTVNATTGGVPNAPHSLTVTPGVGTAALDWVQTIRLGETITGYEVDYSTASSFAGATTVNTGSTSTAYTVTGLTNGVTYYFRVRAINANGESANSATVSTFTGTVPGAPTNQGYATGPGRIAVNWAAPASDGGVPILDYTIELLNDGTTTVAHTATVPANLRTWSFIGVAPGIYDVRVRARNSVGSSAWANVTDAPVPAVAALDIVNRASVQLSDGSQVVLRINPANTSQVSLWRSTLTQGTAASWLADLPIGTDAASFRHDNYPGSLALVAGPDDTLYVIGRRGDNVNTVLARRYSRNGDAWTHSGSNSQVLPTVGGAQALAQFAGAYVPGVGSAPVPTILLLVRRAGHTGSGSLLYATLDVATINNDAGGALFRQYGSDPSWVASAPSVAPDNGLLDIGPLTRGATRMVIAANGWAVVDVSNGVVGGVARAADGSTFTSQVRVLGISGTMFAIVTRSGTGVRTTFYGVNGTQLGEHVSPGSDFWAGSAVAAFDAVYDRVANVVRVYRFPSASSNTPSWYTVSAQTYAGVASGNLVAMPAGVYTQLRLPRGQVDERRVLVEAATGATLAAVDSRQGNVAPTAPSLVDRGNFDATQPATFRWAFGDPNPADVQTARQLNIERASDSVVIIDTGKLQGASNEYVYPGAGLTNGVTYRWRVRTYDALDATGTWSAYDTFDASALGTLTIVDPAADNPAGLITSSRLVSWTYAQADGFVQTQRRVRLIRTSDSAVISDTTMQASTDQSFTVTGMASDVEYTVEVSIVNSNALTVTTTRKLTPSYARPMTPELVALPADHFVEIGINNPAPEGDRPEVVRNLVQRRRAGTNEPWVTAGIVGYNGVLLDRGVRSGTAYEYQVIGDTA